MSSLSTVSHNTTKSAELAALFGSLSRAHAELAKIEARLAEVLGNGTNPATELPMVVASQPALPLEVFKMIASFMRPGTKALLRFMMANKTLYGLLKPRLIESIDEMATHGPSFARFVKVNEIFVQKHVKNLFVEDDVGVSLGLGYDEPPVANKLLHLCRENIEKLGLSLYRLEDSELRELSFPNLKILFCRNSHDWPLRSWLPRNCPRLEVLSIDGDYTEDPVSSAFWTAVKTCLPNLKEIETSASQLANIFAFPNLVGKIKKLWDCDATTLVRLAQFSEFAPHTLNIIGSYGSDDDEPELAWQTLASLATVKNFATCSKASILPLRVYGLPPNVVRLIWDAKFCDISDEQLESFRAKLRTSCVRSFQVVSMCFDDFFRNKELIEPLTKARLDQIVRQLLFWNSLTEKYLRISVRGFPRSKAQKEFVATIEDELWDRSPRLGI